MKYSSKLSATAHVMVLIAINQEKSLSSASIADCGVGINIQLSLQGFYNEIQKTAEGKMNTITLQDIIDTYNSNFFTNNARIAFNTARIITPTSAKIAIHILAIPTAPRIRQISFTPMATEIF